MWQLNVTNQAKEWTVDGHYPDLTTVTKRILELEGDPVSGIFYRVHVLGNLPTPDFAVLSELEYEGRRSLYFIKRKQH